MTNTHKDRGVPELSSLYHHDMVSGDIVDLSQPRLDEQGVYLPSIRPLFMPSVVFQPLETAVAQSVTNWSGKSSTSIDALFVPYGGVFVSGVTLNHPTKGVGFRLALSPYQDIGEFKVRNHEGYNADLVAKNLPTKRQNHQFQLFLVLTATLQAPAQ